MKRIITTIFGAFLCILAAAGIRTEKAGKVLVVELVTDKTTEITMSLVKDDFYNAVSEANRLKCNSLEIKDKNGSFFFIVPSKDQLKQPDLCFQKLTEKIKELESSDFVEGEVIGTEKQMVSGPKYRSETYLNGRLHDSYESDWNQGPFPTQSSTYKSGMDTYITKTFYVPAKYDVVEKRKPGKKVVTPGVTNFGFLCYWRE